MNPTVLYFLGLAQRAGNTPAGQSFLRMAQQAADKFRSVETKWPTMARGPGGQFPVRNVPGDKVPVAPFSRGLAGAAGAGAVAAGSGQFEGVRDRLTESAGASPSIPPSVWGELDARGAGAPPMPPAPAPQTYGNNDMSASFLDGPSTYGREEPRQMPQAARAAVSTARNVVAPRDIPTPPPRPRELQTGAPMTLRSSPDYQSNSRPVYDNQGVNWGDPDNAADFFRAERAMREGRAEGGALTMPSMPDMPPPPGGLMPPDMGSMPVDGPLPPPADMAPPAPMEAPKGATGGGAGGKDAAINKALDIIHKLVIRQGIA